MLTLARLVLLGPLSLTLLLSGCSSDDPEMYNPVDSPYSPVIDATDFTRSTVIDNTFLPQIPGTTRIYMGHDERVVIEVLSETRIIMGIECVVVHDSAFEDGELVEDTFDWFAQDNEGNVWYFGEDSHEVKKNGARVSDGSWEAGVDGALPGIVMLARPLAGLWYRQEFYEGEAEDTGQVVAFDETVVTPAGTFTGCLKTLDTDALEPGVEELKWYAPGIGVVAEEEIRGGNDALELVELIRP